MDMTTTTNTAATKTNSDVWAREALHMAMDHAANYGAAYIERDVRRVVRLLAECSDGLAEDLIDEARTGRYLDEAAHWMVADPCAANWVASELERQSRA